jgi:hypothetical protein
MFDQAALQRRQRLAGKSGIRGLINDAHCFRIALFASMGGYELALPLVYSTLFTARRLDLVGFANHTSTSLLYGYNQVRTSSFSSTDDLTKTVAGHVWWSAGHAQLPSR